MSKELLKQVEALKKENLALKALLSSQSAIGLATFTKEIKDNLKAKTAVTKIVCDDEYRITIEIDCYNQVDQCYRIGHVIDEFRYLDGQFPKYLEGKIFNLMERAMKEGFSK